MTCPLAQPKLWAGSRGGWILLCSVTHYLSLLSGGHQEGCPPSPSPHLGPLPFLASPNLPALPRLGPWATSAI